MVDTTLAESTVAEAGADRPAPIRAEPPKLGSRPATDADVPLVHTELMNVIDESPHYNAEFKAFEKRRLNRDFLHALIEIDPAHVTVLTHNGNPAGALVSGPEFGAVFRYWSWVFPKYRDSRLGMHGMRVFDETFDNGRFHKVFTYVRPENTVALKLLERYGYRQACVLEKHLFGQDYVLVERPYTKIVEGYDTGIALGRSAQLRRWLKRVARRS